MYHNKTWIEDTKPNNCLAYKDFHTNRHGRSMVIATDHNKRENSHDYSILDGISYKKRYYRHVTCFVLLLNEYFNNLKVTRKPEWPEHDYCSLAHITAMGSLGGLSLHTTNDESYTPCLTRLSYKKQSWQNNLPQQKWKND